MVSHQISEDRGRRNGPPMDADYKCRLESILEEICCDGGCVSPDKCLKWDHRDQGIRLLRRRLS